MGEREQWTKVEYQIGGLDGWTKLVTRWVDEMGVRDGWTRWGTI